MPTFDKKILNLRAADYFNIDKKKVDAFVLDGLASGYGPNVCSGGMGYAESQYDATYTIAKANDGNTSTSWSSASAATATNSWWAVKYATTKCIRKVRIMPRSGYGQLSPHNFKIQGSNDSTTGADGTWADISTGLSCGEASATWYDFLFDNSNSYAWYRIYGPRQLLSSDGLYYLQMAEVQMMEMG